MIEDLIKNSSTLSQYGITPQEFLSKCKALEKKFKFKVNYKIFDVKIKSRVAKLYIPHCYISFLYYCLALDKDGVDIKHLIKQFRKSQKAKQAEEIIHDASVAMLAYIYHKNNKKVEFFPIAKTGYCGDFKIDKMTAELKTLQSNIVKDKNPNTTKVKGNKVDIINTIISEITNVLRNKLVEATRQGDMVFINCENLTFFGIMRISMKEIERIVEPRKHRVVFYITDHYLPGSEPFLSNSEGYRKSFGKVMAPDLDKFFGVYIDIDPKMWNFLSQNQVTKKLGLDGQA